MALISFRRLKARWDARVLPPQPYPTLSAWKVPPAVSLSHSTLGKRTLWRGGRLLQVLTCKRLQPKLVPIQRLLVVRLKRFHANLLQGKCLIIILDLEVVSHAPEKIGDPKSIESFVEHASAGPSPAPAPVQRTCLIWVWTSGVFGVVGRMGITRDQQPAGQKAL